MLLIRKKILSVTKISFLAHNFPASNSWTPISRGISVRNEGVWEVEDPPIRHEGPPIRKENVSLGGPTFYRCTDVITLPLLHLLQRVRLLWFVCARTRRFRQNSIDLTTRTRRFSQNSIDLATRTRRLSQNSMHLATRTRRLSQNSIQ